MVPSPHSQDLAGGEGGVGDGAGGFPAGRDGEVPAAGIAQVVLAVAVVADRYRAHPGVGAVGVDEQQQPFGEHVRLDPAAGADRGERGQAAGAQRGLGEHVQQRHHAPPGAHRGLEPAQVTRLRGRVIGREHDRSLLAAGLDLQKVQRRQHIVQRGQLGAQLLADLGHERLAVSRFAQRGVVLGPFGLEVRRQVLVRVAPPVGADHPDLLASQLVPQHLEHAALIDGALDARVAAPVGAVQQFGQVGADHPVEWHVLAAGVVPGGVGGLRPVPLDQLQGVQHRPVHRVMRAELKRVDQLDQPGAVVVGVRGFEHPLLVLAERAALRLVLGQQVHQRALPASGREYHLPDHAVGVAHRRLGDLEQDVLLARHPFQVGDELAHHAPFGAGVDLVHRGDEQIHQGVGDLPAPAVQQRRQQRQLDLLRMVLPQVTRELHGRTVPPAGHHLRRDAGEHPRRQADRPDRGQLGDLLAHRSQAHVARIVPDLREQRPAVLTGLVLGIVIAAPGDQGVHPRAHLRRDPAGHLRHQRLLRLPQPRADDSVRPARRGLLDALLPAPFQQLLTHPLGPALTLADLPGQPRGQLLRIRHRALAETEELTDLSTVILHRATIPLVKPQVRGRNAHLASDIGHDLIRQLATAAREPAMPGVELQQQREAQAGRPALAGDLPQLVTNQRPMLDQLIFIKLHHHARTLLAHPVTRRADTRLRLVTAFLPTPHVAL